MTPCWRTGNFRPLPRTPGNAGLSPVQPKNSSDLSPNGATDLLFGQMVIHFVCRGNTHRSRLAEAYAKSQTLDLDEITILSSGIEADRDLNGPIMPFVKLSLQDENMLQFTGTNWTQTTQLMIDRSDVLVFMNDDVYEDSVKQFDIPLSMSQKWQIADVQGVFVLIKSAVDTLLSQLRIASPER